jgi:hypothetical protein
MMRKGIKKLKDLSEQHGLWSQMSVRLHINDRVVFRKLLDDVGMNFQEFFTACMEAFLRADPSALKIIKDWKDLNVIPREMRDKYMLSHRERDDIAKELYDMQEKEKGKQ